MTVVPGGSVALAWHQGDTRRTTFEVQVSGDGSSWSTVVARRTSGGSTSQPEVYDRSGQVSPSGRSHGETSTASTSRPSVARGSGSPGQRGPYSFGVDPAVVDRVVQPAVPASVLRRRRQADQGRDGAH
ncbi:hypothetical protein ACQPYE_16660 [Actinosynnema sp. CA-299493]